jgi:hypothetical protein
VDVSEARRQLRALKATLEHLVDRDPEQEVQGIALPILDAVISAVRGVVPDSEVVKSAREIISPDAVAHGESVRAADALVAVTALGEALPRPAPRTLWGNLFYRPDA